MNKFVMNLSVFVLLAAGSAMAQSGAVSIQSVTNLLNADTLIAGNTHVVTINVNNTGAAKASVTNGFKVFSPDGATFGTVTGDTLPTLTKAGNFDLIYNIRYASQDGQNADTVSFAGAFLFAAGLPPAFNNTAWTVSFTSQLGDNGKTICIDSSFAPPGSFWGWAAVGVSGSFPPSWSGQKCWKVYNQAVDVDEDENGLPTKFALYDNYPNPFNPTTTISYALPKTSDVSITIYNMVGQEIRTLVDSRQSAGVQRVVWDGRSNSGSAVASGIYLYRIKADNFVETKKMMLVK